MSESLTINNETLEFNKIWYVDCNNGNDTTGDGSQSLPFKTINHTFSQQQELDCIYLSSGTFIEDMPNGFKIPKPLTIIGQNNLSSIVTLLRTDDIPGYNPVICANDLIDKVYRCINIYFKFDYGAFSIIGDNPGYASFSWFIDNCVFDIPNVPKYFFYSNNTKQQTLTSGCIIKNCIIKNSNIDDCYSNRNAYMVINSQFSCSNIDGKFSTPKNNLYDCTFDDNNLISNKEYKNLGYDIFLNPDGTISDIGITGGPFKQSTVMVYYLIQYLNQLKKFNDQNNTFEDISDNQLSVDNFSNFGFDSSIELLNNLKQYYNTISDFKLFKNVNIDEYTMNKKQNISHKIIKLKSINLNNFENIEYIRSYFNKISNLNYLKIFFKKDDSYISLYNDQLKIIDINNISQNLNNLLSIYEFNNLNNEQLNKLSHNNKLYIYLYNNSDDNKINNISIKQDYLGKYVVQENEQLTKEITNNRIKIKLYNNDSYMININKLN